LDEELGVEPEPQTTALYEAIKTRQLPSPGSGDGAGEARTEGKSVQAPAAIVYPPFLTQADESAKGTEPRDFVGRQEQLRRLFGDLDRVLAGQGRITFVIGDAGRGKTQLVQAFSRQAQVRHPDLVVAGGNCNAYTGIGDPYLPFRETLELLTGDVEARWAAGAIDTEGAHRLWRLAPQTC
jgi:hypothetical protein